jgi:tetratricopeptide (TPR) repeat protein
LGVAPYASVSALNGVAVAVAKSKGDDAFRAGDFSVAVERFTHVLASEPRFVAALSNRAAAHLAADALDACIADCSTALQLLGVEDAAALPPTLAPRAGCSVDPVPAAGGPRHRAAASTTLVRRGTALCRLQRLAEAAEDYAAALKLDPGNAQLAADLKRIKCRTAVAPSDF